MKTYVITIKPLSGFGTPLKGDTIFGHFCWQMAYNLDLTGRSLEEHLSNYHDRPFAIFSSMYPQFIENGKSSYALKTPAMPLDELFELPEDKKRR